MYLGIAFILLAWSIFLVEPWPLIGVIGFIIYMNKFQIIPEERAMLSLFGEQYVNYSKNVRRWL
jgi:protein-S-isoprenylcysteine O-methyltransferase Ste14